MLRDIGSLLSTVRPLVSGFRDGERLSKIEVSLPTNNKLAGSGGVSTSTRVPVGTGVDCCGFRWKLISDSKVSRQSVIKDEIFNLEPFSPNNIEASDGSVGSIVVADGSSRSRPDILKSDRSVGRSSKSRVSIRF